MSLAIIKVRFSPAVLPINIHLILMSPFKSKDPGREDLMKLLLYPKCPSLVSIAVINTDQDHLSRGSTTCNLLGLPISITNQDIPHRLAYWPIERWRHSLS